MKQQVLTVNGRSLSGSEKKSYMIKTYTFTTDDDEEVGSIDNDQTISNHDKLLSISSPSIDSYTNDDNASEANTQLTKRKSRKKTEIENHIENKRPSIKKRPWYRKIDLSIPLTIVGICIFIYFMWIKRDVWIPRLLTSNSRIRRSGIAKNEQTMEESTDSPPTSTISSKNSAIDSSHKEDITENIPKTKNDENNNEGINLEYNEDSSPSSKSTNTGKINIRIRRNKMSFNKDRQKKKVNPLQHSSFNDDDDNDEEEEEEEKDKPIETKNSSLSPSTHLTKKNQQHRSMVRNKHSKGLSPRNSTLHFSSYNDILEQLRKNLKSRSRQRGFLSTLSKRTGLNKTKLYRFIYKKDYQFITLQTFMLLLDSFNLIILIVPK